MGIKVGWKFSLLLLLFIYLSWEDEYKGISEILEENERWKEKKRRD